MSALGQKQTYAVQNVMSALPLIATAKADSPNGHACFTPKSGHVRCKSRGTTNCEDTNPTKFRCTAIISISGNSHARLSYRHAAPLRQFRLHFCGAIFLEGGKELR